MQTQLKKQQLAGYHDGNAGTNVGRHSSIKETKLHSYARARVCVCVRRHTLVESTTRTTNKQDAHTHTNTHTLALRLGAPLQQVTHGTTVNRGAFSAPPSSAFHTTALHLRFGNGRKLRHAGSTAASTCTSTRTSGTTTS